MHGKLDSSRRTARKNPILDHSVVGRCYLPESLPQPPSPISSSQGSPPWKANSTHYWVGSASLSAHAGRLDSILCDVAFHPSPEVREGHSL